MRILPLLIRKNKCSGDAGVFVKFPFVIGRNPGKWFAGRECVKPLFLYVVIDKLTDFDDVADERSIVTKFDKLLLIAEA